MLTVWSDIAAGTISAVLGALIVAVIPIGTRPSLWTGGSRTSVRNGSGQQVYAPNSTGPITQTQHHVQLTTQQTIHQNIRTSAATADNQQVPKDERPLLVVIGVAIVTLIAVYSRSYEVVIGFAIGTSFALAAVLITLIYRTFKAQLFTGQALAACTRIFSAILLLSVASWSTVYGSWSGYSMADLRARLEMLTDPAAFDEGFLPWAGSRTTIPAAKLLFTEPHLALVGMFALGAMVLALMWAWSAASTAFAWSSYIGFQRGATTNKRVITRAKKFAELEARFAWSSLGFTVFFIVFTFGFPWFITMAQSGEISRWLVGQ